MAKPIKTCRVCGKQYEACRTANINNVFRWQDVSCSPECGAEYLRRIELSRGGASASLETHDEPADESMDIVMYNEDIYGFEGEPDEEYEVGFGSEE